MSDYFFKHDLQSQVFKFTTKFIFKSQLTMAVEIIRAGPEQSTEIEAIVRDLVEYHKLTGQSVLDQRLLESTIGLFSDPTKYYESFLAIDKKSGKVIGHCMYQKYFSFLAGKVIWMENLYVQDGHRGHKIGQRSVPYPIQISTD